MEGGERPINPFPKTIALLNSQLRRGFPASRSATDIEHTRVGSMSVRLFLVPGEAREAVVKEALPPPTKAQEVTLEL